MAAFLPKMAPKKKEAKTSQSARNAPKAPAAEPRARRGKSAPSISPLLDAENEAAVASSGQVLGCFRYKVTPTNWFQKFIFITSDHWLFNSVFGWPCPGAEYNVELLQSVHTGLAELVESNWPGIKDEEPLELGAGATMVSFKHIIGRMMEHHQWWLMTSFKMINFVPTAQSTVNHCYLRLLSSLVPWKLHYSPMELRMQVQLTNVPNPSSSAIFFSILTRPSKTQLSTWFLNLTYIIQSWRIYILHCQHQVPLRQKSVNEIGERYYSVPSRFHGKIRVAIGPEWPLSPDVTRVKPVSPPENVIAYVLPFSSSNLENHDDQNQVHSKKHISIKLSGGVLRSMYRDNGDEAKLLQWKNFALADFWLQFVLTEHIIHDVTRQSSHVCIYDVSCSGPMMIHGGWWP